MGNIFDYLNSYENVPRDFSRTFFLVHSHEMNMDELLEGADKLLCHSKNQVEEKFRKQNTLLNKCNC
jgi:hypothetical protein